MATDEPKGDAATPDPATGRGTSPKAKGRAPRLTDAALAKLAEITPDEVAEAGAWWAEVAPAKWRGLIGAKGDEG